MLNKKQFGVAMTQYLSKFDRVTNLCEATIHVDKYVNMLSNYLHDNRQILFDEENEDNKIDLLNSLFKPYKIQFKLQDESGKNYGLIKGICNKENITILVGFNIFEYLIDSPLFKVFRQKLLNLIGHELVHRGQYYIRQADFIYFYAYENNIEKGYFSNPQEIMAYAWMGIENMRSHGYNNNQILSKVKNNNVSAAEMGFSHIYLSELKELDIKAYKRFLKYMYQYLVDPIKYDLKIKV
jgi:hypothetical protein